MNQSLDCQDAENEVDRRDLSLEDPGRGVAHHHGVKNLLMFVVAWKMLEPLLACEKYVVVCCFLGNTRATVNA